MQATWQPILQGELADRAWQAILAIYKDLGPAEQATEAITGPAEWSLANGAAGKALFCAYLAEAKDDEAMAEQACDYLEMALESAARRRWAFSLWEGLLGVSWTYDHLAGRLFEAEDEPETSDIEELLMHSLQHSDGTFEYDLLHGLTGYGIACLEGRHRAGARQALDLILDHLTQTAEAFDGGIRWHTPPEDLPTWQRELAPEGYYNLGAAHGIPALITLLARCCQAGIRRPELQPIVDRAGTWVLAQRQPQGFPSWVTPDAKRQEAQRLAWCYGDPGVAGTVLAASLAIGQATWQEQALAIARHAAARDLEHAGLQDAGVCHGTAGLAHIFNRFYQATGCQTVGHAARSWLAETLERRRPGQGLGGYQAWSLPPGQSGTEALTWIDQPGLLTGSAGIGLCLLAAVTPQEPAWDAALGLSAPA